jgi:hypothetical protein
MLHKTTYNDLHIPISYPKPLNITVLFVQPLAYLCPLLCLTSVDDGHTNVTQQVCRQV